MCGVYFTRQGGRLFVAGHYFEHLQCMPGTPENTTPLCKRSSPHFAVTGLKVSHVMLMPFSGTYGCHSLPAV